MRAVVCKAWGPPEALAVEDVAPPPLGPGKARIAVAAAGVNFADTLMIRGQYQEKPPLPFTPGMEVAGVVREVAGDVRHLRPGDRVIAVTGTGGYAEEAVTDAAWALPVPDSVDMVRAAAFPVAYGTSLLALDRRAGLRPGEVLLVLGASGGVGLTAVEIGKAMGAVVVACASSPAKLAVAARYGADHLIDYTREDIRDRVKALTGGADVVYDPVGGAAFQQALRSINWEGRLVVVGFAGGEIQRIPANYVLLKNCSVIGALWGAYRRRDPATMRAVMGRLAGWLERGKIRPHASHVLPLARAAEAMRLLLDRKSTGKVVLTADGE